MTQYATYSDIGGRPRNEDSVRVKQLSSRLCAVLADGLGGHGGGEKASAAAVDSILELWDGRDTPESLRELARSAHKLVRSMQTPGCQMKTTLVVLTVGEGNFHWAYVGDSRLYHFEEGKLVWQTRDHSASQIAVLMGQITQDQVRFHEDRSIIYRALGQQGDVEADGGEKNLTPGRHAFLLCSDGFWEYVYEPEMEEMLKRANTPQQWLEMMRELLSARIPENNDNNTAAAIWVEQK